jgi:transcriptional regulator with XRE-family HTH domain
MSSKMTLTTEKSCQMTLLPNQLRAARSLVSWKREDLAEACGITERNLARIEAGEIKPRPKTVAAIRAALEAAGVEFIPENGGGAGVRLRKA